MRNLIRNVTRFACPSIYHFIRDNWGRGGKNYRIRRALDGIYNGRVLSGPFAGMQYVDKAVGSNWFPKVLGRYESELHAVVEEIVSFRYATIIDVGCAEGYYAIGLAQRCPQAVVFAFDLDATARQLCRALAIANGVADRVDVRGECDVNDLKYLTRSGNTLMIADCEGAELALLDPSAVPWLADADILVELHDFLVPELAGKLLPRFSLTHSTRIIESRPPTVGSEPAFVKLSPADQIHGLGERGQVMQWAWMQAKSSGVIGEGRA